MQAALQPQVRGQACDTVLWKLGGQPRALLRSVSVFGCLASAWLWDQNSCQKTGSVNCFVLYGESATEPGPRRLWPWHRGRLVGALGRLGIPRALLDGALTLGRSGLDERDGVWRQEQPPGEEASAEEVEAWLRSTQHLADWVEAALAAKEGGSGAGGEAGIGNAGGGVWQPLLSAIGAALHEGAAAASEAVRAVAEAGDWRRLQLALALEAEGAQRLPGYVVEAAAQAAQQALATQELLPECGGCESLVQGDGMGADDAGAPGPACRAGLRSLGVEMRAVQATAGGGAAAAVQGLAAAVRRIRADVLDLAAAVAVVRERCLVAAEGVLKYRQAGVA